MLDRTGPGREGPGPGHRPSVGDGVLLGPGHTSQHPLLRPRSLAGPLASSLVPPAGLPAQGSQLGPHRWAQNLGVGMWVGRAGARGAQNSWGLGTGGREEPGPTCMPVPNQPSCSADGGCSSAARFCVPGGLLDPPPGHPAQGHGDMRQRSQGTPGTRHPPPAGPRETQPRGRQPLAMEGLAEGQRAVPEGTQPRTDPLRGVAMAVMPTPGRLHGAGGLLGHHSGSTDGQWAATVIGA